MKPKKVLIDCDPGYDDAVALSLAARSPELEIVGVTCVAGNVEVEKTAANALKICHLLGLRAAPIVKGMAQPLFSELRTAAHVHGASGLDGVALPPGDLTLHPGHAVDFLIEQIQAAPGEITLIPLGPLTNLAMALLREPAIAANIPEIVLMGGALGMGNVTVSAEFNIYTDPEAAKIVFESGIPIVMVGLDVTHKAVLTHAHVTRLRQHGTPLAETFGTLLEVYLQRIAGLGWESAALHDVVAVAAVCDPTLLLTQRMRVEIEIRGEFTRGRTVCMPVFMTAKPPNAKVGIDLDAERFFELLLTRLQ